MGLFSGVRNLFRGRQRFNLKNPRDLQVLFGRGLSNSGVAVNKNSSLTFSAYYGPLFIRARTIMSLPKSIRRRTSKGSEADKNHDQYFLLTKRPNKWQSSRVFWHEFAYNRYHNGNGLAWLEGVDSRLGRPTAYFNLDSSQAEPYFEGGDLFIKYHGYLSDGRKLEGSRPYREFLHVPNDVGKRVDGFFWGEPVYKYAKETIGLGLAAEQVTSQFIKKEGFLHRFFKHPKSLNKEQRQIVAESLKEYKPGGRREDQIPLLDNGMELLATQINLSEVEPSELRNFMIEEGARFQFFPALFKLGHHERSNFANAYQASIEFRDTTVIPDILPILAECNYKLLSPSEYREDTHYVHFETKGLLQADPAMRANFMKAMKEIGALTPNMALDIEDMDKMGPEGDIATTQVQNIPLDMLRSYWKTIIDKSMADMTPEAAREFIKDVTYATNGSLS